MTFQASRLSTQRITTIVSHYPLMGMKLFGHPRGWQDSVATTPGLRAA
jgi:hypothetical protein